MQADFRRPFVACSFGETFADTPQTSSSVEPKVAMLELEILLLEIGQETTVEARFRLIESPTA